VEKPPETDLKTFLDSSKMLMDNLLKGVPYYRHVGSEKIRLTSLGEPEKRSVWRDKLGRKWISSLWYGEYDDFFIYTQCLPYPKGAICNVDAKPSGLIKLDFFDSIREGADEVSLGYNGKIDDWVEYISLGEEYLPTFFHKAKISRDNNRFSMNLKDFSVDFNHEKITVDSTVRLYFGYANDELLAEDLVMFSLFPEKGSAAHYSIRPFFEASPFSPDAYAGIWKESGTGTGDFSGNKINKGNQVVIRKTDLRTEKTITTLYDQKIKKVFTASCHYKVSTAEDIEQDCARFFQGIVFAAR
ncbi:MAG: hypothetical protein D3924_08940, partial [Candidatus Electrothrix sp. AR4]|nr:hypothetical protein [Candidatus Electrothrix sp. AR4]